MAVEGKRGRGDKESVGRGARVMSAKVVCGYTVISRGARRTSGLRGRVSYNVIGEDKVMMIRSEAD